MTSDRQTVPRFRSRWFLPALLGITLVALALRLWTAAATQVDVPIRNDAREYVSYAANLKLYGAYSSDPRVLVGTQAGTPIPDARRPPGYALFLVPFFRLDDLGGFIHRVVQAQAWIGTCVVLLIGLLAVRLLGQGWALAVAAATALSPHLIVYVPYLLSETLYSLAFLIFVAFLAVGLTTAVPWRRTAFLSLAGLALGLTCLVRPTLDQLVWILLTAALLLPQFRRQWPAIVIFLLGFLTVMAPWWARTSQIPGNGQSHAMAITLHQGSYPDLMRDGDPATFGYPYRGDPVSPAAESSVPAALRNIASKFHEHPWQMSRWYLIGKPIQLFAWNEQSGWMDLFEYPVLRSPWLKSPGLIVLTSIMKGVHPVIILLALAGTLLAFVPAAARGLPLPADAMVGLRVAAFVHAYFLLVHLAALPLSRYSVPFRPLTYLMAAYGLMCLGALVGRWRERSRPAEVPS